MFSRLQFYCQAYIEIISETDTNVFFGEATPAIYENSGYYSPILKVYFKLNALVPQVQLLRAPLLARRWFLVISRFMAGSHRNFLKQTRDVGKISHYSSSQATERRVTT